MNKFLLTIFCLTFVTIGLSGQYQIVDQVVLGGTGDDRLFKILPKAENGFIAVGITTSNDLSIPKIALQDIWLRAIDRNFNLEWELIIGGFGSDYLTNAFISDNNEIFVCGTVDDRGRDVAEVFGEIDAFIAKININGSIEWFKTFGTEHFDAFNQMVQSSDDTFGAIGSILYLSDTTGNDGDILLYHFDFDGNKIWEKKLGSSLGDEGLSIFVNNNGNYFIAGYIRAGDGDVSQHIGAKDLWLAEIDLEGNLLWEQTYGGIKSETPIDVIQHSSGAYIVIAETFSTFENSFGNSDLLVLKVNEASEPIYKVFGGSSLEIPQKVIELDNGNLVIVSESFSFDGDVNSSYLTQDAWFLELDLNLNIVENQVFGGNQYDSFRDIFQDNDILIVCGYTDSYDGDLGYKHGNHDAWIARLSKNKTGLNTIEPIDLFDFEIYQKQIIIKSQDWRFATLFDVSGKAIIHQKENNILNINMIPKGVYFLRIQSSSAQKTFKILISN